MVSCMKTTVEIAEPLLAEAKRVAAREGTSIRALIEEGLRGALDRRRRREPFRLRRASCGGNGLRPEVREGAWERIRDLIYDGRGG